MKRVALFSLFSFFILLVACALQPPQPVQQPVQQPPPAQEITIGIKLLSAPTSVEEGQQFEITWRVLGKEGTIIPSTAVHYDVVSHPGSLGFDVLPQQAGYKSITTENALGEYLLPSTFTSKIKAGTSKIYYRIHAIINGENYWTQEYSIDVVKAETNTMGAKNYAVAADDRGANPNSLVVSKGSKFTITFNVGTDVYYGGLDFRSSKFTSPKISPRGTWTTPELTADETFKISAYWPAQDVKKWDLTVNVG